MDDLLILFCVLLYVLRRVLPPGATALLASREDRHRQEQAEKENSNHARYHRMFSHSCFLLYDLFSKRRRIVYAGGDLDKGEKNTAHTANEGCCV